MPTATSLHELTKTNYQLPTTNYQLPTTNYLFRTINPGCDTFPDYLFEP